jgi:Arc/MetJ family transcription regulator
MRTTLDIPESLILEVMEITNSKTKSDAVKMALESLIHLHKVKTLLSFKGKIDLDVDIDTLRGRQ